MRQEDSYAIRVLVMTFEIIMISVDARSLMPERNLVIAQFCIVTPVLPSSETPGPEKVPEIV